MDRTDIQKILEALLFVAEQPVSVKALLELFDRQTTPEELTDILQSLSADYAARGSALEIKEIAGGWQFASRPEFGPWIRKLFKDRLTYRLSSSAMETLSIIAYKQPITRNEIEEIRGVEVTGVLETLLERKLVKVAGRKETIGRPLVYATTPDFLRAFGLRHLEDLPSVETLLPPDTATVEAQTALPLEESEAVAAVQTNGSGQAETPAESI